MTQAFSPAHHVQIWVLPPGWYFYAALLMIRVENRSPLGRGLFLHEHSKLFVVLVHTVVVLPESLLIAMGKEVRRTNILEGMIFHLASKRSRRTPQLGKRPPRGKKACYTCVCQVKHKNNDGNHAAESGWSLEEQRQHRSGRL